MILQRPEMNQPLRRSNMIQIGAGSLASRILPALIFSGCLALGTAIAAPTFAPEAICRTAIAAVMGRDPKLVQVTRIDGDILFLSYVRPIDNFVWDYRCKIEGNRVVWASEPGRWRDNAKDGKVFFEVIEDGKQLQIMEDHSDGSRTKELFDRDKIL
jgi:hypothetical protein